MSFPVLHPLCSASQKCGTCCIKPDRSIRYLACGTASYANRTGFGAGCQEAKANYDKKKVPLIVQPGRCAGLTGYTLTACLNRQSTLFKKPAPIVAPRPTTPIRIGSQTQRTISERRNPVGITPAKHKYRAPTPTTPDPVSISEPETITTTTTTTPETFDISQYTPLIIGGLAVVVLLMVLR